ncbi:MAG: anti-anti-sigma factor [Solirubrobacterales bacterium]|jgi:anti-sigma B factor antagonist|nr:anti-anti-sigma factor [Solirubrobacterales bacterium]
MTPEGPEVRSTTEGDVVVVAVAGDHDIATADEIRGAIDTALAAQHRVVVDLTPATFVDSTVLGVLLGARDQARDAGLGFGVLLGEGSATAVQRITEVTGLASILPLHDARDAALAGVRAA